MLVSVVEDHRDVDATSLETARIYARQGLPMPFVEAVHEFQTFVAAEAWLEVM